MKKLFILIFLFVSTFIWSYNYPPNFGLLLRQFSEENKIVIIVTNEAEINKHENEYEGKIVLVSDDYIVLKEKDDSIVLQTCNIVSIAVVSNE